MAHWKRLTGIDGNKVDVNMDQVTYMLSTEDATRIFFAASGGDKAVKETIDKIHLANREHSI